MPCPPTLNSVMPLATCFGTLSCVLTLYDPVLLGVMSLLSIISSLSSGVTAEPGPNDLAQSLQNDNLLAQ